MRTSKTQDTMRKLHLTPRGRFVLAGLIVALVAGLTMLSWFQAATSPAMASHDQTSAAYQQIMVQPGDTLWGIAARVSQQSDLAVVLDSIVTYNDLKTSELEVGDTLYVPVDN